jgi:hypothetical protein
MTLLEPDDARDLSDLLCVRDKDGRIALRVGLLATMFFAEPWTRSVREAVAEAADEYVREFRTSLRWAENPKTGHMYDIRKRRLIPVRDWLLQHPETKSYFFGFHSGELGNSAAEFQVSVLGGNNISKCAGFFQMYLPLTWFADRQDTLMDFVLRFAARLRPISGYAGVGLQEPLNVYSQEPFQSVVRPIAERFPGLEIESPGTNTIDAQKGIKGVNWITILGDRWVQEIGGIDYLRMRLGDDFKIASYEGGLAIQAGPKPQIGDVTTNRWPRHYVTLAKVLKPIQIKVPHPFHLGDPNGSARLDSAASLAWLCRFDGK